MKTHSEKNHSVESSVEKKSIHSILVQKYLKIYLSQKYCYQEIRKRYNNGSKRILEIKLHISTDNHKSSFWKELNLSLKRWIIGQYIFNMSDIFWYCLKECLKRFSWLWSRIIDLYGIITIPNIKILKCFGITRE